LTWHSHQIVGQNSYLGPWQRIVTFANNIAMRISERFPSNTFLQALGVLNPAEWKKHHDTRYSSRISTFNYGINERNKVFT